MNHFLLLAGRIVGLAGVLLSLASGLARIAGQHWIGGFETLAVLQGGVAGMVLGCLCLLLVLTNDTGKY